MIPDDIYYISVPYSNPLLVARTHRFNMVNKFASILVAGGLRVYSPISHSHPMVDHWTGNQLLDHQGWINFERPFMNLCTHLIVLQLEGWESSKGVELEFDTMVDIQGKPVFQVFPYNLEEYPDNKEQKFRITTPFRQPKELINPIFTAIHHGLHAEPVYSFRNSTPATVDELQSIHARIYGKQNYKDTLCSDQS